MCVELTKDSTQLKDKLAIELGQVDGSLKMFSRRSLFHTALLLVALKPHLNLNWFVLLFFDSLDFHQIVDLDLAHLVLDFSKITGTRVGKVGL